jgi:hypothetical protein
MFGGSSLNNSPIKSTHKLTGIDSKRKFGLRNMSVNPRSKGKELMSQTMSLISEFETTNLRSNKK